MSSLKLIFTFFVKIVAYEKRNFNAFQPYMVSVHAFAVSFDDIGRVISDKAYRNLNFKSGIFSKRLSKVLFCDKNHNMINVIFM